MDQRLFRPSAAEGTIWVQPCEEYIDMAPNEQHTDLAPDPVRTQQNVQHAVQLCMRYGYRLSLQLHKILGLP